MQQINKIYRKDYIGEAVNIQGSYKSGAWDYVTERIANPFANTTAIGDAAIVIGNGISRLGFNMRHFLPYKTGVLDTTWHNPIGAKKFLTYGCNALYREYRPDFLVVTGDTIVDEIANSGYCDTNAVYGNNWVFPVHPSKYAYIPQDPGYNSGAIAAYLAAFDGHKRVFMMGFDGIDATHDSYTVYAGSTGYSPKNTLVDEEFWVRTLLTVMNTYSDTEFIRVMPTSTFRTPEAWKYATNFRTIDFRQFVVEADV